jgi:hypothetical protein
VWRPMKGFNLKQNKPRQQKAFRLKAP